MAVMPGRCQNASKSSVGCCHAREALDRGRFGAGALSASGTREPHGRSEVDWVYRAGRSANLKTCEQLRAKYFYEACTSATRADATGVKAPARHPSQCSDPEFRCSVGNVSSTIASSALPPGRLIGCVLSGGCAASRATRRHAERSHRAHHSRAGRNNFEKQTVSIDRVDARWVGPIVECESSSKASIHRSVAKAASATVRQGL